MIEWFVIIVIIIVFLVTVSIKVTVDLQGSNFAKKKFLAHSKTEKVIYNVVERLI